MQSILVAYLIGRRIGTCKNTKRILSTNKISVINVFLIILSSTLVFFKIPFLFPFLSLKESMYCTGNVMHANIVIL